MVLESVCFFLADGLQGPGSSTRKPGHVFGWALVWLWAGSTLVSCLVLVKPCTLSVLGGCYHCTTSFVFWGTRPLTTHHLFLLLLSSTWAEVHLPGGCAGLPSHASPLGPSTAACCSCIE